MASPLVFVLGISLLLVGAGLFAWMFARDRQQRIAVRQNLDRQLEQSRLKASHVTTGVAGGLRAGTFPPAMINAAAHAAGATASAATAAAARESRGWDMPPWLLGAIPRPAAVAVPGVVLAVSAIMASSMGVVPAVAFLAFAIASVAFGVWFRLQGRRKQLVAQLPGFMDAMVRMITIGNSTQGAFQNATITAKQPLRDHMEKVTSMLRAGVELEAALLQVALAIRIDQLVLLASVLGLGVRYGGRADVLLERMGNFMRDEEQAERELQALSAETRMSAWILGMLPVLVGGFIIMINAAYFVTMWGDPSGRSMMLAAIGLQIAGGLILWRMARLD